MSGGASCFTGTAACLDSLSDCVVVVATSLLEVPCCALVSP